MVPLSLLPGFLSWSTSAFSEGPAEPRVGCCPADLVGVGPGVARSRDRSPTLWYPEEHDVDAVGWRQSQEDGPDLVLGAWIQPQSVLLDSAMAVLLFTFPSEHT